MEPIISLYEFVQNMYVIADEVKVFLNIRTGEFVTLLEEELRAAEEGRPLENFDDWQQESIQEAAQVLSSDDYLELPSKFDIHEYSIMRDFCCSVEDEALSDRLLNAIRRRGAFRRFKNMIYTYGIEQDWYDYRTRAFKDIAIDWLESHHLAYKDDDKEPGE